MHPGISLGLFVGVVGVAVLGGRAEQPVLAEPQVSPLFAACAAAFATPLWDSLDDTIPDPFNGPDGEIAYSIPMNRPDTESRLTAVRRAALASEDARALVAAVDFALVADDRTEVVTAEESLMAECARLAPGSAD